MPEYTLSFAMPAVDPDDEDHHDCCCVHVAAEMDAMPGPQEEKYAVARERYYACPHHELTPLEVWLEIHRQWLSK